MNRLLALTACLCVVLVGPAAAQDPVRVYVGPLPSASGIVSAQPDGAADSHRDIRKALSERKNLVALAQLVDSPAEADVAISVDVRHYSVLVSGKKLIATATVLRSRTDTATLDGSKGFVKYYRVQAGRIAEQAETWLRANAAAIQALRPMR